MESVLVPAYLVLFCWVETEGIRHGIQEKEPPAVLGLEIAMALVAGTGFVLYHLGYRPEGVIQAWRFVGPALVLGYGYLFVRDVRALEPESDLSDTENVWIHTVGAWFAIVVICPALWFNLALGFGF